MQMTTPSYNPGFAEPSQSDPQAAQPNQSLGQQARTAWGASGQTGVVNAAKFGYQFGKNAAQQGSGQSAAGSNWAGQASQTIGGYFGSDPASHGTTDGGWSSGGNDAGPELATSEDVAGLHSRFDELSSQVGGMQSGGQGGGGQGNLNQQQFGGAQANTRDFRCLWRWEVFQALCSMSVLESVSVMA